MTVEVAPMGITCNLGCTYCYQHPMRDAGNFGTNGVNFDKVIAELEKTGEDFTIFGGEALLTPKEDLKKLFEYGYEKFGRNDVQTNGVLIDDEHIEMFKEYNVSVGFSVDGPGRLNDLRWAGTLEKTRDATQKSVFNMQRVIEEGIPASLIITLHKINVGTEERLEELKDFLFWLDTIGINGIRFHDLEVDTDLTARKHVLSKEEKIEVFLTLADYAEDVPSLEIDLFKDIYQLLSQTEVHNSCVWGACDPLNTQAVHEIDGEGNIGNCGMVNKEGINWVKADSQGFERYIALYQTPQENGGCKDCRFWSMCRGQCPGSSTDGDWRNKSDGCELWKSLFTHFEEKVLENGIQPLSLRWDRSLIEAELLAAWKDGREIDIDDAVDNIQKSGRSLKVEVK